MLRHVRSGKVRELFEFEDPNLTEYMVILTTNRVSAFDVILPSSIPFKGRTLCEVSDYFMEVMKDLIPNHLVPLAPPRMEEFEKFNLDFFTPRQLRVVRKFNPLPIEAIIRGHLIGSGWKDYQKTGKVCGIDLPKGLILADRLPQPIFTPSTKAEVGHDENISFEEMVDILGSERKATFIKDVSLNIFVRATSYAIQHNIIIADTKLEFGEDDNGRIYLIDEVLTPDSSRFWPSPSSPGTSPASYDKQIIRDYLETLSWDKSYPGPELPQEIIEKTSNAYKKIKEVLVG